MEDAHNFKVAVVTPAGKVFDYGKATLVVLHTVSGETGVMANHNPFVSALRISEVKVKNDDEDYQELLAVNGGFVEFTNNQLTIVADAAEKAADIDVNRAETARQRAERRLKEAHDKREQDRAQAALLRAVNRIHAATGR